MSSASSTLIFKGDSAFVCFIADTQLQTPNGVIKRALRISDYYTKQDGKWIQSGSYTAVNPDSARAQIEHRCRRPGRYQTT